MDKIVLITTKGCEACAIMRNSIKQALSITNKDIEFEEKDMETINKKVLSKMMIRDFPTTLFFSDSRVVRKEVGTRPHIVVLRWIDISFK